MGFIEKLFGKEKIIAKGEEKLNKKGSPLIGKTDTCPYCDKKLNPIPSKKKKCNFCGEFVYVRTRPQDRKRVMVNEKGALEIEDQWHQYHEEKESNGLMQDSDFSSAKKDLTKQFGEEPSLGDVKWRVYNQRIIEYASQRKWGLYRNNKHQMAVLLEKENKLKDALSTYFEVIYLDINGCNNVPTINGKAMSFEESRKLKINDFDQSMAFLAPGVIFAVKELIEKLKISEADLKKLYIDSVNKTKPSKNMPVSPKEAWVKFQQQSQKKNEIEEKGFSWHERENLQCYRSN